MIGLDIKAAVALAMVAAAGLGLNVSGALEMVVLVAAAIAAVGVIWTRALRPVFRFARKASAGVEILLDMPPWRHGVNERLESIERRLEPLESIERRQVDRRGDVPVS